MVRRSRFIGVGIGIGIGIDSSDAIVSGLLSDCVPTLAKLRQHGCPFDSDSDPESCDIHAGSS
jgi:hypothetical protein